MPTYRSDQPIDWHEKRFFFKKIIPFHKKKTKPLLIKYKKVEPLLAINEYQSIWESATRQPPIHATMSLHETHTLIDCQQQQKNNKTPPIIDVGLHLPLPLAPMIEYRLP
jgi:hypothetical protein